MNKAYLIELSSLCRLEVEVIEEIMEADILPEISMHIQQNLLHASDIAQLQRLRTFLDMGINVPGIELILEMRNRIMELQKQLRLKEAESPHHHEWNDPEEV